MTQRIVIRYHPRGRADSREPIIIEIPDEYYVESVELDSPGDSTGIPAEIRKPEQPPLPS